MPSIAMPDGFDAGLWAVLSDRLRDFLLRHPDRVAEVDVAVYRDLPSFVDFEWVRSRIDIPDEELQAAHRRRNTCPHVVAMTDWPDNEEITLDEMALVHLQAMRLPLGLYRLSRAFRTRQEPFRPLAGFFGLLRRIVDRAAQLEDVGERDPDNPEIATVLVKNGDCELARDYAFLESLLPSIFDSFLVDEVEKASPLLDVVAEHMRLHRSFMVRFVGTEGGYRGLDEGATRDLDEGEFASRALELVEGTRGHFWMLPEDLDNEGRAPHFEAFLGEVGAERPQVRVPSFIDAKWLKDRLSLSGAVRSQLHQSRDRILSYAETEAYWPTSKPNVDEIAERMFAAFSMPLMLTALNHYVLPRDPATRGNWDNSPFRPFYKKIAAVLRGGSGWPVVSEGTPDGTLDAVALQQLLEMGQIDLAREFCCLRGSELFDEEFVEFVRGIPGFEEVVDFLSDRRRLKAWWQASTPKVVQADLRRTSNCELPPIGEQRRSYRVRHRDAPPSSARLKRPWVLAYGGLTPDGSDEASTDESGSQGEATMHDDLDAIVDADRDVWVDNLWKLSSRAMALAAAEPSREALADLRACLEAAEAASVAWELSRPKLVEVAPYAARLDAVRADLVRMIDLAGTEQDAPAVPAVATMPQDMEAELERVVASAETGIGSAKEAEAAFEALNASALAETRYAAKIRLNSELALAFEALRGRIDESVSGLQAAATLLAGVGSAEAAPSVPTETSIPSVRPVDASPAEPEAIAVDPAVAPEPEVEPEAAAPAPVEEVRQEPTATPQAESAPAVAAPVVAEGTGEPETAAGAAIDASPVEGRPEAEPSLQDVDLDLMATLTEPTPVSHDDAGSDPMAERIDQRLLSLMVSKQFGLAHHLAAAAKVAAPGTTYAVTPEEMRFAAAAGRLDHAFLQTAPQSVAELLASGLDALDGLPPASDGPVAAARRILMYPTALELVLFHPDSGAVEVLRSLNGLVDEVQEENSRLVESAMNVSRSRLPLSPAVLSHVSNTIEAQSGADAIRATLLARIEAFARTSYSFQLATRIRTVLYQPDGLIGLLRDAMQYRDAPAAETAARDFVKATETRSLIVDAFDRAEMTVNSKFKGLDGPARDRMVAVIQEIRTLASEYLDRRAAARLVTAQDTPRIREAVSDLRRRLGATITAFERLAQGDDPHLASAAKFASDRYLALDVVLAGDVRVVGPLAHSVALHAALPLLEHLQFGRSWLPTPYDAAEIVEAILSAPEPLLPPPGPARDAAYEALVGRRVDDGSLVGARMLIDLAAEHQISEEAAQSLAGRIDADEEAASEDLRREAEDTRTLIERVMRFGSLTRPEEAVRLASVVDRVSEAKVPVRVQIADRTEEVDVERIYDVKLASALLAEAAEEARGLLDEPRNRLLARIDAIAARLPSEDVQRLRSLCADDDLLTAEELVALAETQGAIVVPTRQRRSRFAILENETLPAAVAQGRGFAEVVAAAIAAGTDLPGAPFSELPPSRREGSGEIFASWRELFRHIEGGAVGASTAAEAGAFLESLGIALKLREVSKLSNGQRRIFVADWEGRLPTDAESQLLPDFGSLTHGGWRTAFTTTLPGDAVLADIVKSAGSSGVMLLVAEVVSKERRERFLIQNLEARRRICLIDAASLVQALAEPELRGLTPIELGQPYSFAWPFRDYEREAVPRELFVGRRQEMETLFEAAGSCVVYGGRRIGKTALLKHLVETRNAPAEGTLVAFVDAQEIGSSHLPKKIWDDLQKALPTVFDKRSLGSDQRKVAEEIERWLKADPRRRILVLIDEADAFVRADAAQSFAVFHALQDLMTNTGRRFKFVMSGLHNVTRIAQVGNAPILQISSNPQRIGPLMGEELKDAEDLIVRPFAAMGIQFERREDVWKVLSHANYLPVLAQTLAKHLLEQVIEEAIRTGRAPRTIGRSLVARLFEARLVRDEVRDKFLMTLRIDTRYELLAYVVADLVLGNEASGVIEEGVSVRLIRDRALECWPKGFADRNRVSLFDDLVDEMEGLGILRQVAADRWTLRSTAVTRLLGTRDEVETKLIEFLDREGPNEFDPKSHRRLLEAAKGYENADGRPSPLTLVQERELLADPTPVKLVFGTPVADVDLVSLALDSAPASFSDGNRFDVVPQIFTSRTAFIERLRQVRGGAERTTVLVVDVRSDWTPDWAVDALKVRVVVEKAAKVVFVGTSRHAAAYAADPRFVRLEKVRAFPLEPWSSAFVEAQLMRSNAVVGGEVRDALLATLGGWNNPLSQILQNARGNLAQRVEKMAGEIAVATDTSLRLGLDGGLGDICRALAELNDPTAPFDAGDVSAVLDLYPDLMVDGVPANAEAVCSYGVLVGAFEAVSGGRGEDGKGAAYAFAPLVRRYLSAPRRAAA
ncbi:AAA family ATPase [Methylobacterium fujisawaense]